MKTMDKTQFDVLTNEDITRHLENKIFNLFVKDETGSTNDDAKALAEAGSPEFTVIAAEYQTKGKGRRGRSFFSPKGTGIYFSIILRPQMHMEDALFITTMAAAATASAIEEVCAKQVGIKWVNDIFVGDKKVCGILTESSINFESEELNYAILGIGINVIEPTEGFPAEIQNIANGLLTDKEYKSGTRTKLLAKVLDNFYNYYSDFENKSFLDEYRSRSIVIGKHVTVHRGETAFEARALSIDDRCRLHVEKDGEETILDSGEVSIRL